MTEAFRRWFGRSVVRNADGSPKRVYHGTRADFDAFDMSKIGTGMTAKSPAHDADYVENALWFAESIYTANFFADHDHGGRVLPVYLRIENPLVVDAEAWARRFYTLGERFKLGVGDGVVYDIRYFKRRAVQDALADGHDGVIFQGGYDGVPIRGDIYVVFDPRQVKSAIGNTGRFDPSSSGLLHGLSSLRSTRRRGLGSSPDWLVEHHAEQRHLRCSDTWKSSDGLATGLPLDRALPLFARIGRRLPYRGAAEVEVYRVVPAGVTAIRPGDWVALTRAYVATMPRGRGQVILAQRVNAADVVWAGTDENEWWWCPR